jgi:hypothetical protein
VTAQDGAQGAELKVNSLRGSALLKTVPLIPGNIIGIDVRQ